MPSSSRSKLLTYWVVPEEDQHSIPPYPTPLNRLYPKWTCFSLLTAAALILCGLLTTLWVWTRYGTSGFPHAGSDEGAEGGDTRPGMALLLLGPVVTLVGVVCVVMACVVHEARQRQEAVLQRRAYQVLYDAMTYGDDV